MKPHAIADQFGREDVALHNLAEDEYRDDDGDPVPLVELREGDAGGGDEPEDRADEGDEGENARDEPDHQPEIQPGQRQRHGIEGTEQETHRGLAAHEAGEGFVHKPRLLADGVGMLARQQRIDMREHPVPIAQEVEGDDGRDEDQRQDVHQGQAAGHQGAERLQGPVDRAAGEVPRSLADLRGLASGLAQVLDERLNALAHGLDDRGEAFDEADHLVIQGGEQEQEQEGDDDDEGDRHHSRRQRPAKPHALQPVAEGIEEIGHRRAGDEGRQHLAQEIERQDADRERRKPEPPLPRAAGHAPRPVTRPPPGSRRGAPP